MHCSTKVSRGSSRRNCDFIGPHLIATRRRCQRNNVSRISVLRAAPYSSILWAVSVSAAVIDCLGRFSDRIMTGFSH